MKKTKKNIKQNDEKIQVGSTVVDTLQPVSSLSGSCRGAAFQKKVLTMTKKGSPHLITFSPDPNDSHFFDVRIVRKATGEIRGQHYILKSDVPQWLSYFESQGFTIKNSDNGQ